jgi:hypothetical protein
MSRLSRNITTILGPHHKIAVNGNWDDVDYGWRDLTADLSSGRAVGANAPTWAAWNGGDMDALSFSAGVMNEVWVTFHPNHDVAEGLPYYPHVHWMPNTTSTGVVRWGIDICSAKGHNQAAFSTTPTTIYLEDTISADSQYQHRIIEASDAQAATLLMPEVDSLLLFRVFRDAAHGNDTFPDAVFGLTVDIHYQADRWATLNKAPNFNEPS